ncbi:MAG: hypothetical protein ABSF51_07225 [Verrucomicrobiota bacterium]|jgi:hypothetical protein
MKTSNLKKIIIAGLAFAGLAFTPNLRADTQLLLSGGSASSGVIFERATNLFGGTYTVVNGSSSTTRTYYGSIPGNPGLGTVTLAINLAVGAVGALNDISVGNPEPVAVGGGITSSSFVPTVVDSSASPGVIGVDSSQFVSLPTYIVPYVFIKNTNSTDTAGITNLTQNQAAALESSGATIPGLFFGGSSTNVIYFVGRNRDSAVRTEIDLNINATGFQTYTTNSLGQVVQDTTNVDLEGNVDPGQSSGGAEAGVVAYITDSIGEVAVQNIVTGTAALAYNGVAYSTNSVIDGSYALWNPENYYYIAGNITTNQLAVLNLFYSSITNSSYWSNSQFKNKFIPTPWVNANLTRNGDGGPIKPNPGYTVY